jgi:transposase
MMTKRTRRNHSPAFKAKVALAAVKGEKTLEGAAGVFGSDVRTGPAEPAIDVKTLHAKIGELTLVNDFLSGALGKAGLLPSAKR